MSVGEDRAAAGGTDAHDTEAVQALGTAIRILVADAGRSAPGKARDTSDGRLDQARRADDAKPLAGGAPQHPPGLDAPGKGRFRWRYTLWYTWPRKPPTQQDLRDFVFTTWATVIGGSGPAIGVILLIMGLPWALVAAGVAAGTVLAGLLGWPYVMMGRRDWRRLQA